MRVGLFHMLVIWTTHLFCQKAALSPCGQWVSPYYREADAPPGSDSPERQEVRLDRRELPLTLPENELSLHRIRLPDILR